MGKYDSLLEPEAPTAPSKYSALLEPDEPAPAPAPPKSRYSSLLDPMDEDLAADPSFDLVEHYGANPSAETLATARNVFRHRANQPINYGDAALKAAGAAVPALAQGVWGMAKGAAHAVGNIATEISPFASDADQQRAQRENAAALQLGAMKGWQLPGMIGRNIGRVFGHTDKTLTDAEIDQRIQEEAAQRATERSLTEGHVAEGGIGEPLGFGRVERKNQSPEQLAAQGAPVSPESIEGMSFLGDPSTYAILPAAHYAGPIINRAITAPVLRAAGATASGLGRAAEALHGARGIPLVGGAIGYATHAMPGAAIGFSAELAARHLLPRVGAALTEAGEEAAGRAFPPVGQNILTKGLKEGAKSAVTGGVLSAPFVAGAQTPEEAGGAIGGGIGIGAVLGTLGGIKGSRQIETAAKAGQLANEGARMNYGLGWEDEGHARAMQTLPPEVQHAINVYRGRYNGITNDQGIPHQIYALSGPDYARAVRENQGGNASDTRGFVSPDGTKVVINADMAAKLPEARFALGHEVGGHLTEFLAEVSQARDLATLRDSMGRVLYKPDGTPSPQFSAFQRAYARAMIKSGATPQQAASFTNNYFNREFLAQHAVKILNGEDIASFNLPKPLSERLTRGASDWLRNQGILPKRGGDIGWTAKEIPEVTGQLRDILYSQGAQSEALRAQRAAGNAPAPTLNYRARQLQQIISRPITGRSTTADVQARDAAIRELATLRQAVGQQPAPQPVPVQPASPQPQPATPTVQPVAPQPAPQPAPVPPVQPAEQPAPAPIPQPNGSTGTQPQTESPTFPPGRTLAPPEPAAPLAPPARTERQPAAYPRREEVDALVAASTQKAIAAEKNPNTKAAQGRILAAKVNAILDAIGDDQNGIHRVEKPDGSVSVVGDFDPENPYHQALAELGGGLDGPAVDALMKLQDAKQRMQFIRYRSALSSAEGEGGEGTMDVGMENRRAEYENDPARQREEGTIQHKVSIPIRTEVTADGRPMVRALTLDNILHNAESIREFMRAHPELGEFPYQDEATLVRDAKVYADNHAHGWKGDGSAPMQQFPDSGLPRPDLNYRPETIPKDRFDALNMTMVSEDAGKYADRVREVESKRQAVDNAKTDRERAIKQGVIERSITRLKNSEEAKNLAALNNPFVGAEGESNQLRERLKAAGFKTGNELKPPFEMLDPRHILETSDSPIAIQEGDIPSVRPTGFQTGPDTMEPMSRLNPKAVSANFLPADTAGAEDRPQPVQERAAKLWAEKGTESPFFKKWFGKSKIVDDTGKPLVVHHGTADEFTEFDLNHPNRKDTGWLGTGVYVTSSEPMARSYMMLKSGASPSVMNLYAKLENPYFASIRDKQRLQLVSHTQGPEAGRAAADEWTQKLKDMGHDGVILDYKEAQVGKANASKEIVVFDPAGVKSATGNAGTFDPENPSVNFLPGGEEAPKTPQERARERIAARAKERESGTQFLPQATLKDDLSDQSSWMDSEAKLMGFSGANHLAQEDPAGFSKMARAWRVYHPRDERGLLLQAKAAQRINNALYGDRKSDSTRPIAGTRDALGDAASYSRGGDGASAETPGSFGEEQSRLQRFAQDHGLEIARLPTRFTNNSATDAGGTEHHVWKDPASNRWVKVTRAMAAEPGAMGAKPIVTQSGTWNLDGRMMPSEYLESRTLWNKVFGDDIRLHGILTDGRHTSVVTSQPHIGGEPVTKWEIARAMEARGFSEMGSGAFYRKADNVLVADLHDQNAVKKDGALLPFDGVILHPLEELIEAMQWEKATGKAELAKDDSASTNFLPKSKAKENAVGRIASRSAFSAYNRLKSRLGYPAVPISDLQKESGAPMDALKDWLSAEWKAGNAQLSTGDWSIATPEEREGVIEQNGRKHLQVRFTSPPETPLLGAAKAEPRAEVTSESPPKDIAGAYQKLVKSSGFPTVPISKLQSESGMPMDAMKDYLRKEWEKGNVVLSVGDWSIADEAERAGAIEAHGRKYLQARFPDTDGEQQRGGNALFLPAARAKAQARIKEREAASSKGVSFVGAGRKREFAEP